MRSAHALRLLGSSALAVLLTAGSAVATDLEKKKSPVPTPTAPVATVIPSTTAIYDPMGGLEGRNLNRADLPQCSQWWGGPIGTLVPAGMEQPAIPIPGIHGLAATGYSSACKRFEALAQGSVFQNGFFGRANLYRESVGSYDIPGGGGVADDRNRWNFGGGVGWARADGSFLSFDTQRMTRDKILYPGASIDTRRFDVTNLSAKGRLAVDHEIVRTFRFQAGWTDYDRINDNYSFRTTAAAQKTEARFKRQVWTGQAAVDGGSGSFSWTLGTDVKSDHRDATRYMGAALAAQSPVLADATVTTTGVTADGKWAFAPDFRLLAGLRLDLVQARLGGMDRAGMVTGMAATPTPRALFATYYGYAGSGDEQEVNLGGSLRLEKDIDGGAGRLFAGVKRVVRTADPRERYFASFTPPAMVARTWIGNPDLAPEQHHVAEIGGGWANGRWELATRAYADHVTDFILWDRARGQSGILVANGANVFHNVDAFIGGVEAKVRHRFDHGFWAGAEAWATYGENLTDSRPIGQIPPLEASLRAGWMNEAFEVDGRWRLVAGASRIDGSAATGSGSDAATGGFATVDVSGAWKPKPNIRLSLGVENVFDRRYAEHIERTDIDDPMLVNLDAAGRTFWGRASIRF